MGANYLRAALEDVQRGEQEVVIHDSGDDEAAERVADYFEPFNVDVVRRAEDTSQPPDTVALREDGTVVATSNLPWLDEYLTCLRIDDVEGEHAPPVLNHIDTRTFTSMNVRRMVLASREIETMAHRVGDGSIHSGFQELSRVRAQIPVYRKLVDGGLDVHLYGADEGDDVPPRLESLLEDATVTCDRTPELAESWFVLFESEEQTAGMFAVVDDADEGTFEGCWSYDADAVEDLVDHLTARYEPRAVSG